MDKYERFTEDAFKKVTDQKVIDAATRRADELKAQVASKLENNEIS